MSESVSLPALGESVTEGTVTRWLKRVGDRVEVDEPLLEVSTDKVDTEIPSPVGGIVEAILVQEDETVAVGTPLVTIGAGTPSAVSAEAPETPAQAAPEPPVAETPATPLAGVPVFPFTMPPSVTPSTASLPSVVEAPLAGEKPASDAGSPQATAEVGRLTDAGPNPADIPVPLASAPFVPAPFVPAPQPPVIAAVPVTPVAPTEPAVASTPEPPVAAPVPVTPEAPAAESVSPVAPAPECGAATGGSHVAPGIAYITPIVRKLAHDQGVDLATLTGTGVGGRIRKQDVLAAATPEPEPEPEPADTTTGAAPAIAAAPVAVSPLRGTTQAMSRLRKVVADRAVASMQGTAQLTSVIEADVTLVAALRDRVKAAFLEKTGTKLSFMPFFAKAIAEALQQLPVINATVDGDYIVYPAQENLSIAVDTERGLLTPVIRDTARLSIAEFATQIADLADRTRNNALRPDELAGGTFTLTNTGSRGALFDTPVVFLPQSAILGTGMVVKRPAVVRVDGQDAIAIRSMVYLALSYDHRIIDGADAARFLTAVKDRLEAGAFEADLGI